MRRTGGEHLSCLEVHSKTLHIDKGLTEHGFSWNGVGFLDALTRETWLLSSTCSHLSHARNEGFKISRQ